MRISLIVISTALLGTIFLGLCGSALAQGSVPEIGKSLIHPAHPLYFLKAVREALELRFANTTQAKAARYLEFAQRRVREVKSLAEVGRPDLIAPTLEHYFANLQKVLGLADLKTESKVEGVADIVDSHAQNLAKIYSNIDHQAARRSIRTTIFRVWEWNNLFKEKLDPKLQAMLEDKLSGTKAKVCHFLAKEASSSALNEVEREVLLARVQKCS